MLRELYIKNFVLVKESAVFFKKGLNIITGETGAGKSVLIGSLSMILGERASSDIIRKGENKCSAQAVVDIAGNSEVKEILEEAGIDFSDDYLIIKREIFTDGNNRQYINGSPVPLSLLKKVSANIFDLHGQHDHQSLFNIESHRKFLDWYADIKFMVAEFTAGYHRYNKILEELSELEETARNTEQNLRLWKYEVEEINSAELAENEEEELEKEYTLISKAKEICEKSYGIYETLYADDNSVHNILGTVLRQISDLAGYDDFFDSKTEVCEGIICQVQEMAEEIRMRGETIEFNPSRLAEIEQRIQVLEKLKRKFSKSIPEILEYKHEL